jgi:hypothetical protein
MFLCGGFSRLGLNADAAGDVGGASRYGIAAASMVFLFTFVFGATWLTVPWLYPAEIFPLAVRAKGNAWGVIGWSIGNGWCVSHTLGTFHIAADSQTLLLPVCFEHIGEKTYYLFGIANAISIPIVWAFYPESNQVSLELANRRSISLTDLSSRQRTLEEIDFLFASSSPFVWHAEATFRELSAQNPKVSRHSGLQDGGEKNRKAVAGHNEEKDIGAL